MRAPRGSGEHWTDRISAMTLTALVVAVGGGSVLIVALDASAGSRTLELLGAIAGLAAAAWIAVRFRFPLVMVAAALFGLHPPFALVAFSAALFLSFTAPACWYARRPLSLRPFHSRLAFAGSGFLLGEAVLIGLLGVTRGSPRLAAALALLLLCVVALYRLGTRRASFEGLDENSSLDRARSSGLLPSPLKAFSVGCGTFLLASLGFLVLAVSSSGDAQFARPGLDRRDGAAR